MAHFEDFELAQSVHRELQQLRARAAPAASVELDAIAAKAALPADWQRRSSTATIDSVRTDTWLAICRLAGATMRNGRQARLTSAISL
jgi:hypothetical protein